tara:strand:- start:34 stop:312 length:279 start_codon:yes stop_codon:yes gene_type:complete
MALTKSDIVKNIAQETGISKQNSKDLLDHFLNLIKMNLKKMNPVKISNFGTFEVKRTPSRMGRNPKTKQEYIISERNKITLKTSKNIKNFLN